MADMEQYIKNMYGNKAASQKEQLTRDYLKADSDLTAEQQKSQKTTADNLNRTAAESKMAAMNSNEYYAAAGLSSGAMMQSRLSRDNQTAANMTTLRAQQQETDADIERRRSMLADDFASAIRQAQADNDWQMAQALYDNAQTADDRLHDERMLDKQQNFQSAESEKDRSWQSEESSANRTWQSEEAQKDRTWQSEEAANERTWQEEHTTSGPSSWEVAKYLSGETGDMTYVGQYLGATPEQIDQMNGVDPRASGLSEHVNGMYKTIDTNRASATYSTKAQELAHTMTGKNDGAVKEELADKWQKGLLTDGEVLWILAYMHIY